MTDAEARTYLDLEREIETLWEQLRERDEQIRKLTEEAGRLKARLVLIAEYARKI